MALISRFPKKFSAQRSVRIAPQPFIPMSYWNAGAWVFLVGLLCAGSAAWSQEYPGGARAGFAAAVDATQTNLPDAPEAAPSSAQDAKGDPPATKPAASTDVEERAPQTKRILWVLPNFRSVSTDVMLPPQSIKEKFLTASDDSFDYSAVFIPLMLAGYSLGTNQTPEFGQGGVGYGRYLWHAAVDQTSENYMVEFVGPVLTREDTRYYTLGRGGFLKRTGYALSRVLITRADSGREVFNISEVVGAGAASGLSSLYYPSRERSMGNTGTEWGLDVAIDAVSFVAKEFWPDLNRHLFHTSDTSSEPSR